MADDDHSSSAGEDKAVLGYDSEYRDNGYNHIKGNGGKVRVYNKKSRIMDVLKARGTKPRPATCTPGSYEHAKRYYFTHDENYKSAGAPYPNQAHHLLPADTSFEKFTADELTLLRKVEYDINRGENIMFLPTTLSSAEFQNLPIHKGKHPSYTNAVKTDMKGVQESLKKVIDADPDHKNWSPPSDIPNKFKSLETKYWNLLKNAGMVKVSDLFKAESDL